MAIYAVTAASGRLGRLVIEELLARGARPDSIVAIARDTAKLADVTASGVQIREGDYDRPSTLDTALAGVDRLLLISGNVPGARVKQHETVVSAAVTAGVRHLLYTSGLNAGPVLGPIAADHVATEGIIENSGLSYTLLRNGMYTENYVAQLPLYLQTGKILGAAGEGRLSTAARRDFAGAAAVALLDGGSDSRVYDAQRPSTTPANAARGPAATARPPRNQQTRPRTIRAGVM